MRSLFRTHPWLLALLLLVGSGRLSQAQHTQHMQAGEKLQLTQSGSQTVVVEAKQASMYRIETEGESDTHCTLIDRQQGQIAVDDNGGVAKNCRIDIWLTPGKYQLQIQKQNRPVQLIFSPFQVSGNIDPLLLGQPYLDELTSGQIRGFRIHIKRRRWLQLSSYGVTVNHCYLLDQRGWLVSAQKQIHTHHTTPQGYLRSCQLQRLFEPGEYTWYVQGDRSLPAPQGRSVAQGSLLLLFGEQTIQPFSWYRVALKRASLQHYDFQLPVRWGNTSTGKVKILVQISKLPGTTLPWSVRWQQQDWLSPTGQTVSTCSKQVKQPEYDTCSMIAQVEAGKRYVVEVSGALQQQFRMRYVVIFAEHNLPLNKRIRVLDQPGQTTDLHFAVAQEGTHWIESWPKTRSCLLEQEIRPHVWKTITTQSMALAQEVANLRKKPQEDHRSGSWTTWLSQEGTTQWLHLESESTVLLKTTGETDTHCALYRQNAQRIAENDDENKENRNCSLEQRLQAGLYRWTIRAYQRPGITTISLSVRGDRKNTTIARTGSCSFAQSLKPGQYRLRLSASGRLHLREVGVFSLPLQNKQIVRIPEALRTLDSGPVSSYRIPVRLHRNFQWIQITGVQACGLYQGQKAIKSGWMRRASCRIRGRFPAGRYDLVFSQQEGNIGSITLRIGASVKTQILTYRSHDRWRATSQTIETLQESAKHVGRWSGHTDLQTQQTRSFLWTIRKTGIYRLQSRGLLQVQCSLSNARDVVASSSTPTLEHRNCQWTGLLQAGAYRLDVQAAEHSTGRVKIQIDKLPTVESLSLQDNQHKTALLTPEQGHFHPLTIRKPGHYLVDIHSIDSPVFCRLEDEHGWPVWRGEPCQFWQDLKPGHYRIHLIPRAEKSVRYRISAYTKASWKQQWPQNTVHLKRNIRSKPKTLPLNRSWVLGYEAAQPSDTLLLPIPTEMTLSIELSQNLIGQLYQGAAIVAQWAGTQESPHMQKLTLKPGTYRLILQGKYGSLQAHNRYTVKTNVVETQANVHLWSAVPSSLVLNVPQAGGIQLGTEGRQDVWCQIFRHDGSQVAFNDDVDASRWDCKIAQWLPAGKYRVQLDGVHDKVWLQLKPLAVTEQILSLDHPRVQTTLQPHQRHAFVLALSQPGSIAFQVGIGRGKLSCMMEDMQHRQPIEHIKGMSCDRMYRLQPGRYKFHVYHTESQGQTIHAQVRSLTGTFVKSGIYTTLQVEPGTPIYLKTRIPSVLAQFQWKQVTSSQALQCSVTTTTTEYTFPCTQPHLLDGTVGLHPIWKIQSNVKQTVEFTLQEALYQPGQSQELLLRLGQVVSLPVLIKNAGLYRLRWQGQNSNHWHLRWNQGVRQEIIQQHPKPRMWVYLPQGQHTLALYHTAQQPHPYQTDRVFFEVQPVILESSQAKTASTGVTEGVLESGQVALWQMKRRSYHVNLTLHGNGEAFVLTKAGDVVQHCHSTQKTWRNCRWYLADAKRGLRLWLRSSDSKLLYRWKLTEAPYVSPVIAMSLGTQWKFPNFVQNRSQWQVLLQGQGRAVIEVVGQHVQCSLHGKKLTKRGCLQSVELSPTGQHLSVVANHRPDRILLYAPQQRAQALWGSAILAPKTPTESVEVLTPDRWTTIAESNHPLVWYQFRLTAPRVVSFKAQGNAVRCLLRSTDTSVFWATQGNKGCRGVLPLHAGEHWLGLHSDTGHPVGGRVLLSTTQARVLQEGEILSHLLGTGESLWFSFSLSQKAYVGVGAVGRHDELVCDIRDEKGTVVAKGCQRYLDLDRGTYWYRVSLPNTAEPTWVRTILRGKMPPPNRPPTAYLKQLLEQASSTP